MYMCSWTIQCKIRCLYVPLNYIIPMCMASTAANAQVFTNIHKYLQVFTNVYNYLQAFTSIYEYSQVFTSIRKYSRLPQIYIKTINMHAGIIQRNMMINYGIISNCSCINITYSFLINCMHVRYVCMYIFMHVYVCVYVYMCVYVCMYECMYVCMYVCIYEYKYLCM